MRILSTPARGAALACALTLTAAPTALAAAGTGESTPLHLSTTTTATQHVASGGPSIVHTIIALVIVVALIYGVTRVLRSVKGRDQRASGDGLQQLATLPLGTNKSIALVRSGSDIVLIGVADSGVTAIKTYSEAEALANGITVSHDLEIEGYGESPSPAGRVLQGLRRLTVRP